MKSIYPSYTWAMVTLVLLIAGFGIAPVRAQEPAQSGENKAQSYFTDTVLINQNGERMRFYTDLMKGKTVIIDTFFATCQASCLPMNRNLALIQEGRRSSRQRRTFFRSVLTRLSTRLRY